MVMGMRGTLKHDFDSSEQNAAMNLKAPENIGSVEDLMWLDNLETKNPELAEKIHVFDVLYDDTFAKLQEAEEKGDKKSAREIMEVVIGLSTDIRTIDIAAMEEEPESSDAPVLGVLRKQIEKKFQNVKKLSDRTQMILMGDSIRKEQESIDTKAA